MLGRAATIKERLVRSGHHDEFGILLDLRRRGTLLGALRLKRSDKKREDLPTASVAIAMSDADQAAYVADTHVWRAPFGTPTPEPMPVGCLARWFAQGNPYVFEALSVIRVTADGRSAVGYHPYTTRGRSITWGEVFDDGTFDGDLINVLKQGFRLQQAGGHHPRPVREIAEHLDLEFAEPPRVERNHPCPCGSGRKTKRCCHP